MSDNWIKVANQVPEIGQEVWYFFEHTGVWKGKYLGPPDDAPAMKCFGGQHGWLCDDVTHWMPASNEKPQPPVVGG